MRSCPSEHFLGPSVPRRLRVNMEENHRSSSGVSSSAWVPFFRPLLSTNGTRLPLSRWVADLGVGGLSVLTPMYQSETAPRYIRGALVRYVSNHVRWENTCLLAQLLSTLHHVGYFRCLLHKLRDRTRQQPSLMVPPYGYWNAFHERKPSLGLSPWQYRQSLRHHCS